MNRRISVLWCVAYTCSLMIACKASPSQSINDTTKTTAKQIIDKRVSIVNLVATPEKYDQKNVRVIGFLNLEFEGNAIYLHKDDYDLGIDKNGIWVDLTNAKLDSINRRNCNKQYVILEGTFDMNDKGHSGGYSGSIIKITRINLLK